MPSVGHIAQAVWPCGFYLVCSMSMNILTKTILTTYGWSGVYSLAAIQHVFTFGILSGMNALGFIRLKFHLLSKEMLMNIVLPASIVQTLNTIMGFVCMQKVNMPMYLVLRRLTTFKVMLMEILILKKAIPDCMKASLLITATGSLLAGFNDATSDGYGYVLVIVQNCLTSLTLILSKKTPLEPLTMVYLNSITSGIILVPIAMHFECQKVVLFVQQVPDPFIFGCLFILMSVICLVYQLAIQICTTRTSALATSVTGNIKDLASTLAGYCLFTDVVALPLNVFGVLISFVGAYSFSYFKYMLLFHPESSKVLASPWTGKSITAEGLVNEI
ncbi:hypothetical protein THRCLA_21243 [Thraustotheca clavata]|uniref:Sugar phosphate transporter domain-containing protein n=1 Tax=Thraustotheca clavata TaxID=74557 RepID=A0A1V9ZYH3_9STRA|nr:hypothetical protein THRCLA_21243 [Thraustotheca clavata]